MMQNPPSGCCSPPEPPHLPCNATQCPARCVPSQSPGGRGGVPPWQEAVGGPHPVPSEADRGRGQPGTQRVAAATSQAAHYSPPPDLTSPLRRRLTEGRSATTLRPAPSFPLAWALPPPGTLGCPPCVAGRVRHWGRHWTAGFAAGVLTVRECVCACRGSTFANGGGPRLRGGTTHPSTHQKAAPSPPKSNAPRS